MPARTLQAALLASLLIAGAECAPAVTTPPVHKFKLYAGTTKLPKDLVEVLSGEIKGDPSVVPMNFTVNLPATLASKVKYLKFKLVTPPAVVPKTRARIVVRAYKKACTESDVDAAANVVDYTLATNKKEIAKMYDQKQAFVALAVLYNNTKFTFYCPPPVLDAEEGAGDVEPPENNETVVDPPSKNETVVEPPKKNETEVVPPADTKPACFKDLPASFNGPKKCGTQTTGNAWPKVNCCCWCSDPANQDTCSYGKSTVPPTSNRLKMYNNSCVVVTPPPVDPPVADTSAADFAANKCPREVYKLSFKSLTAYTNPPAKSDQPENTYLDRETKLCLLGKLAPYGANCDMGAAKKGEAEAKACCCFCAHPDNGVYCDYGMVEGADGDLRAASWDDFCLGAVVPNADYLATDLKKTATSCTAHRKLLLR
uniref:Pherophorin domain-containing protein n=1 Tax=Chlamydomonas leiostraca TaxID=1034604 RepID=A0A7S0WX81_9CHLO|mmetsp:Transcript_33582/g.85057  ORF Transcript_33582/g.85057 Transcript_33582/m.85057 type:complete len:427 (+) Transcript_33582:139-1419(+)